MPPSAPHWARPVPSTTTAASVTAVRIPSAPASRTASAATPAATAAAAMASPATPRAFAASVARSARCASDIDCCQGNFPALCCFNGTVLDTVCTDVSTTGYLCPGDAPAPVGCPAGQTDCGGTCVDLSSHAGHCGACFASCALGGICRGGACRVACADGLAACGGYCVDLQTDFYNCGACGNVCGQDPSRPWACSGGHCLDVSEEPAPPAGGGGDDIDDVEDKADPCYPREDGHPNDVCMETGEEAEEDQN